MKTAIYIEDGIVQLVITPESSFERNALASFKNKGLNAEVFTGSFYDCRGGWTRQNAYYPSYGTDSSSDDSLILRIADPSKSGVSDG